jgi:hypothetical protein
MRLTICTLLAALICFEVSFAGTPAQGPPNIVVQQVAKLTPDGDLWLQNMVWRPVFETTMVEVPYTVQVVITENGNRKIVPETRVTLAQVTHCKFVGEPVTRHLKIDDVQIYGTDGKRLENIVAAVAKLSAETTVLVTTTGDPPTAESLSVFQPGTLVLGLPLPNDSTRPQGDRPPGEAEQAPEFSTPQPQGPPPHLTFASVNREGKLKLTNRHVVQFESKVVRTNGKPQEIPDVIRGTDTQIRVRALNAATATFFDTEGETLTADKVSERLKQETLLVESSDEELPDPFYMRLLRKGVLVMALPGTPSQQSNAVPPTAPPAVK